MGTLIKNCNEIVRKDITTGCNVQSKIGYPKWFLFGKNGDTITSLLEIPTPAEVQTYLNLGTSFIIPITNGVFVAPELQSETGADTFDGLTDITREDNGIDANFKILTNDILEMIAQNNLNNTRMQLWIVDNNNKLHGGKIGFQIPFYIPNFQHAGFGANSLISMSLRWERKIDMYVPISEPNVAYGTLTNYISDGVYTETVVATYVAGQVTGYSGITGWAKGTYETLYAKIVSNVITFYGSNADRTAGTNALATCDSGVSLAVTEATSSGFGGVLTFVSNAITDNSTWNIAFTA